MVVLSSKLTRAGVPPHLVDRPRLYQRLNRWAETPVLYVHAPAGYGKTVLVSRWIQRAELTSHAAWLTLDALDRDPVNFVHSLAAALETFCPGLRAAVETARAGEHADALHALARLLACLEDAPALSQAAAPRLLVLDDLHVAHSPAVNELLALALSRTPAQLHWLLIGQEVAPPPLARSYAAGDLLELSTDDLRFRPEEVRHYLDLAGFEPVDDDELDALMARSEGWIALLHLAALVAHRDGKKTGLSGEIHCGHGWLQGYLTDQVLAHRAVAARTCLLETSVLDAFTDSLAAAVTTVERPERVVADLVAAGLPLFLQAGEGAWYRYHPVLRELLQRQLRMEQGEAAEAAVHRRAAQWFAAHGDVLAAVGHALAGGEDALAASILEAHAMPAILRGEVDAVAAWLGLLTDAQADRYPRLLLARCVLAMLKNQGEMLNLVQRTERVIRRARLAQSETEELLAEVEVLKAVAYMIQGDLSASGESIARANASAEMLDGFGVGTLAFARMQSWLAGRNAGALHDGFTAIENFRRVGFDRGVMSVQREQAWILAHTGRGAEALAQLEELVSETGQRDALAVREVVSAHVTACMLHYWMDQVEHAAEQQQCALTLAQRLDDADLCESIAYLSGLFAMARIPVAAATTGNGRNPPPARRSGLPQLDRITIYQMVRAGHAERSWLFAASLGYRFPKALDSRFMPQVMAFTRAAVAYDPGLPPLGALLDDIHAHVKLMGSRLMALDACMLSAWRYVRLGQSDAAQADLSIALDLAVATGYERLVCDIPEVAPLLAVLDHPAAEQFWVRMVPPVSREQAEALTTREREVLILLAQRRSYQEIAGQLDISINTVRTHLRNVYARLGVKRRKDAVLRAKSLGLVREAERAAVR